MTLIYINTKTGKKIEVVSMRKKQTKNNKLPEDILTAVYSQNVELVNSWLSSGNIEFPDSDGRTILFHAVLSGFENIVDLILKNNPNLNLKDKKGWYPLHYAAQNYYIEIADLLIKNGAEKEVKDNYGNTPLWRAVFASQGKGEMIKLFLARGLDSNNKNDAGVSPLALAKSISNYDIEQFFDSK